MEEAARELELPSSTSTTATATYTTTTSMEEETAWADWSPLVDRERFSLLEEDHHNYIGEPAHSMAMETFDNLKVDKNLMISSEAEEDSKGVRLVHLLLAAAEAMSLPSCNLDLAGVILVRLKELACPASGSIMERLAAHFAVAMEGILDRGTTAGRYIRKVDEPKHGEMAVAAFQLLQDMSPYVKFGHFTANQAILEAVADARRVHIVDFDIMEGVQWASLMQALVSREGFPATPSPPHLRITAVARASAAGGWRKSAAVACETGRRLAAFAASLGQPFSFQHCRLGPNDEFRPSAVKLVKGEAVVVNCMLHLPHASSSSAESVSSFLSGAALLGPRLMVLVEEEISQASQPGFVPRFMDSLHHYAALYDSLEAGFPLQSRARTLVERAVMGPRIAGTLERSFGAEEGEVSWGEWMGTNGFRPWSFSWFNHCQAKLLVGLFNDGYCVEELKPNKLVLGWKSRRFLSASVWAPPSAASPTQSSQNSDFQECHTPTWSVT